MDKDGVSRKIRQLIEGRLNELAEVGEVWRPEWIAKGVVDRFSHILDASTEPDPEHDAEFWRHCGYQTVRAMVANAIRKRTDPSQQDDSQPTFPELPLVHAYYDVKREDEWVGVPVRQLTAPEGRYKVAELRRMSSALADHADQLELFFRTVARGTG